MNERIRELAEKSGFVFWTNEPWKPEGAIVDWANTYDIELQKLSELIVQECIQVIRDTERTPPGFVQPKNSSVYEYCILKHFADKE